MNHNLFANLLLALVFGLFVTGCGEQEKSAPSAPVEVSVDAAKNIPDEAAATKIVERGKFCKAVNATKQEALAVTGVAAGLAGGATTAAGAAGVTAVVHSSGAVILTGGAGYIAGTLGTVGAATVAVLASPVFAAAAGVSLVAVGTAVYVCK